MSYSTLYEGDPLLQQLLGTDRETRLSRALRLLGFVLLVDGCARNCRHCPAYGAPGRPRIMPWDIARATLVLLREFCAELGVPLPSHSMHCWRISDPLDYQDAHEGVMVDCVDMAPLWGRSFGQGLYLVTNGSEGQARLRRTLERVACSPELFSQVKLTITPFDRQWGTERYYRDIRADVSTLAPLWNLRSARPEDPHGRRFRINVKVTPSVRPEAEALVREALYDIGYSRAEATGIMADARFVSIKPVYDLQAVERIAPIPDAIDLADDAGDPYKSSAPQRVRYQFGLRPDLSWFLVDMYRFRELDIAPGVLPAISDFLSQHTRGAPR